MKPVNRSRFGGFLFLFLLLTFLFFFLSIPTSTIVRTPAYDPRHTTPIQPHVPYCTRERKRSARQQPTNAPSTYWEPAAMTSLLCPAITGRIPYHILSHSHPDPVPREEVPGHQPQPHSLCHCPRATPLNTRHPAPDVPSVSRPSWIASAGRVQHEPRRVPNPGPLYAQREEQRQQNGAIRDKDVARVYACRGLNTDMRC